MYDQSSTPKVESTCHICGKIDYQWGRTSAMFLGSSSSTKPPSVLISEHWKNALAEHKGLKEKTIAIIKQLYSNFRQLISILAKSIRSGKTKKNFTKLFNSSVLTRKCNSCGNLTFFSDEHF